MARLAHCLAAAALLLGGCAGITSAGGFTPRLTTPRLDIVDPANITEAQRDMLGSRANLNIYRTLAHHPDLEISWATVTVRITTHSEGGLTEADFELADRIDAIA